MAPPNNQLRVGSNVPFVLGLSLIGGLYVFLIVAMVVADLAFTSLHDLKTALASREIRYAIKLSLYSCCLTAIASVWIAVPLGYLMSRYAFRGKQLLDAILDIPIFLPPLVIGLSLLILFQTTPGQWVQNHILPVTYKIPAVILAQFAVACAFAVRTMRVTFDQINPRNEQVALTLGCNRARAFWLVAIPEAQRGIITALTLSWARALGEFGPILIFAGATRMHTEVLSTTVFLELSVGNIGAAVAVSLLMILVAVLVLILVRLAGTSHSIGREIEV